MAQYAQIFKEKKSAFDASNVFSETDLTKVRLMVFACTVSLGSSNSQ